MKTYVEAVESACVSDEMDDLLGSTSEESKLAQLEESEVVGLLAYIYGRPPATVAADVWIGWCASL